MSQLSHAVLTENVAQSGAASRPNYVGGRRQRGRPRVGRVATDGQPQRWEALDNLGAVKADGAGITYAVERDWLILSGALYRRWAGLAGRKGLHLRFFSITARKASS
jgi:hypothetical protein